jgi:uncharacterized membrane protein YdbT with pleckstrin-like domain
MPEEEAVLTTQPSLKNYAKYWLIAAIAAAGAILLGIYRKAITRFLQEDIFKLEEPGAIPTVIGYAAVVLVAIVVVLVIVILWKRACLTLRVHSDRVIIERGILAKSFKELFITDIRTIDINQSIFQRLMGTGDMIITTPGTQPKDVLKGFPDPSETKDTIIHLRQKKKEEQEEEAAPAPAPQPAELPESSSEAEGEGDEGDA